jgi:Asp/Glu/hydantoin racemase
VRLWHQSRTELDRLPGYRRLLAEHFSRIGEPGTEVILHGMAPGTYVTEYPGDDTRHMVFSQLHSLQVLNNARQAEREGYDGFLLMNLPETVLEEAQTLVDIPVVGYGQACMYAAAMLGRRFAILAMIRELIPLYESHIIRYGMQSRAWGVEPLGLDHVAVFAGFEDPEPVVRQIERRTRELAAQGVDVIIPGEAPVAAVLAGAGVTRVDGIPVLDTLGVTLKFSEAMVRLAQVSGLRSARAGYNSDRPPAGRLAELERFYRLVEFGAASGGAAAAGE